MSPEAHKGRCTVSCDVWSVGCILYEFSMLERLFSAKEFNQVFEGSIKQISKTSPTGESWEDLSDLYFQMMNRDRPKRRPSCQDIIDEFDRSLNETLTEGANSCLEPEAQRQPIERCLRCRAPWHETSQCPTGPHDSRSSMFSGQTETPTTTTTSRPESGPGQREVRSSSLTSWPRRGRETDEVGLQSHHLHFCEKHHAARIFFGQLRESGCERP